MQFKCNCKGSFKKAGQPQKVTYNGNLIQHVPYKRELQRKLTKAIWKGSLKR